MFWKIRHIIEQFVYDRFYARCVDMTDSNPMVTFTFDDFPLTALYKGGRLLEKYGANGTFYLAPGLLDQNTDVGTIITKNDIKICIDSGHELAHHTYSHLDCTLASKQDMIDDTQRVILELGETATKNFSFPFGRSNTLSKIIMGKFYKSCRGIQNGINRGIIDILDLRSYAIYSKNRNIDFLMQTIKDTKKNGGWLIFYTHDVTSSPSPYGCTEENLESLIQCVIDYDIPITTVDEALTKLMRNSRKNSINA